MGQPVAAVASWAHPNKPIWQALVDPVGQPSRQNHEFLNRFFIHTFVYQENPRPFVAASLVIGRQCHKYVNFKHARNSQLHPLVFFGR
jgi:hypothetical protein